MTDVTNLRSTIEPKSDQLNAEDLMGVTRTITVTGVKAGTPDQPITINYEGDNGRPYKPCKSMRRVLIYLWGDDGRKWSGQSMTLYCDPEVKFGGVKVGGIRISHMTGIDKPVDVALTVTRGKRAPYNIQPLKMQQQAPAMYPAEKFEKGKEAMRKAVQEDGKTPDQVIARCQKTGQLTDDQIAEIRGFAEQAPAPEPEPTADQDGELFDD